MGPLDTGRRQEEVWKRRGRGRGNRMREREGERHNGIDREVIESAKNTEARNYIDKSEYKEECK